MTATASNHASVQTTRAGKRAPFGRHERQNYNDTPSLVRSVPLLSLLWFRVAQSGACVVVRRTR